MKIVGLTRIRNESAIIKSTLDHYLPFCNGGIFVYDDASTDDTVSICKSHPAVSGLIESDTWEANRPFAEMENRNALLKFAREHAPDADFFLYFDADERVDFESLEESGVLDDLDFLDGVKMRLYDFYITAVDHDLPASRMTERRWLGPEYREILMLFKNDPSVQYNRVDHREANLPPAMHKIKVAGAVKHYGKAVSVDEWEKTCDYYAKNFPEPYKSKWAKRKGKAVHTLSDQGRDLITWEERLTKGVKIPT